MKFSPQIVRSFRRSIVIHISPKGEVIVKAPRFVSDKTIVAFIHEKEEWIQKTLQKVHAFSSEKKQYTEGELFWFFGEKIPLRFYTGIEIRIENNTLYFPKVLQFRIRKELEQWYIKQAKYHIQKRLEYHSNQMDAGYTHVFFSDTTSKWGTCFADNTLQFNWRLIMAPLMVVDYVIIHELVHTTEKNHSDTFWRKVRQYTPAYKQHRKWLNDNGGSLIV